MKKFLLIFAIAFAVGACSKKDDARPYVLNYTDNLVEQYPGYKSNDMAREIIMDSIHAKCETYVGKDFTLFDGVNFKFIKLFENEQAGTVAGWFRNDYINSDIESTANGGKYVMSSLETLVLGTIDAETASQLASGYSYKITGKVHDYTPYDDFCLKSSLTDIFFGTFVLDDMTVTKVDE